MDYPNKRTLVNLTQYAAHWGITRDVVYDRLKSGDLIAYNLDGKVKKTGDLKTTTYLVLEEDPKSRPYTRDESKND